MNTFIRAVEVWVPGADRTVLDLASGLYAKAPRFGAASRAVRFARGEGLPGQAWAQGRPLILKSFEGSYFRRTEIAHAEGLTCGIAVPIFAGDFLTSVLVMFCGDDAEHAGAIELWHNDPTASADMLLDDGYYGTTAETFEFMSRRTTLRRGNGLPGMAWESGLPVFMEDLGKGARFLHADTAVKVGINRGFAIPCPVAGPHHWVMGFLSALGTPIARRFEIWTLDARRERLQLAGGFCETQGTLATPLDAVTLGPGEGTIGTVFITGVPAVTHTAASEPGDIGRTAEAAGLDSMVALPVIQEGRLVAVVAMYL